MTKAPFQAHFLTKLGLKKPVRSRNIRLVAHHICDVGQPQAHHLITAEPANNRFRGTSMDSFNKREILIILAIILFAAALAAWATMYVKNRYYAPRVQTSAQAQEQ
jgi:hypothetical protein